jgi:general secretion pathway protein F
MPVFEYKGFDARGKAVKGLKEADSARALRTNLRKEGVMVTEVAASGAEAKSDGEGGGGFLSSELDFSRFQRVSVDELGVATRQLATLLQAGVPMVESLTALIDQVDNGAFKRILAQVKTDVNEGTALAAAMEKHKVFDHIYVNMVRAGESSGTLDLVLERLADFKEGQARLKGEVIASLFYPVIMVFVGAGLMGVLFTVVVPKITKIFEHSNAQLPWMTRALIFMSETGRDYWWLAPIVIGGGAWLFKKWTGTEKGRAQWDRMTLRFPIFGSLMRMIAVARFSRTLSTLLSSGVSLLTSLEITRNVVNNTVISGALDDTRDAIREGEEIAPPLKRSKQFPPMVIHMIAIGEKSGQLEQMLHRVADSFEHRVDNRLRTLTALLTPVMILAMGGSVGFIVFAILKPILEMNTLIK